MGVGVCSNLDVQGQGSGKNLDVVEQGVGGLENWTIFMDVMCVSSLNIKHDVSPIPVSIFSKYSKVIYSILVSDKKRKVKYSLNNICS